MPEAKVHALASIVAEGAIVPPETVVEEPELPVEPDVAAKARLAVERMLEIG